MSLFDLKSQQGAGSFRWLTERMWSVEHAFERAKAEARAEEDTRVRITVVLAVFALAFGGLTIGAARAALFSGIQPEGAAPAAIASRADLVDREGRLMAVNLVHYGVYIDPDEVWDVDQTRNALLSVLPQLNPQRLQKALTAEHQSYIIGGLTPQDRERVHALGLPGVSFAEEDKRVYPLGQSASHLIGFVDGGGKGIAGIERSLDEQVRTAGRNGAPIVLSIDMRVQGALADELGKEAADRQADGAVGIVTDIQTGEILGMASWPDYDPNQAGRTPDNQRLNRAAQSVFEMGSTFKVFTLATGLDTGRATINTMFDATTPLHLGNRQIHDHDAQDRMMSMADVFIHSSNIGTSRLALELGKDPMTRYFSAFGLFKPAPIELAESARPILPRVWSDNTLTSASFGHAISVTPLQLTAAMGSVLNGGVYVPLTLRKRAPGEPVPGRRVVSAQTSRTMLDLMRMNVVRGTGTKADAQGLSVGGKTGTAQKVVGGKYSATANVSSFAAVFPTDGPPTTKRYFVLILLDNPKGSAKSFGVRTGAWTSAPAAGRVIDRIAPFLHVERRATAPVSAAPLEDTQSGPEQ